MAQQAEMTVVILEFGHFTQKRKGLITLLLGGRAKTLTQEEGGTWHFPPLGVGQSLDLYPRGLWGGGGYLTQRETG